MKQKNMSTLLRHATAVAFVELLRLFRIIGSRCFELLGRKERLFVMIGTTMEIGTKEQHYKNVPIQELDRAVTRSCMLFHTLAVGFFIAAE
jgi:hypothetical protein